MDALATTLADLTDIQRRAVDWGDGPLLVLAGPGAGKTRVLTCRIARLLDASRDQRFRILALTFTNKAAHEMAGRVATLVPSLESRATVDTFHGFCARVLRQHGVHLGIRPDFAIYSQEADRQAVLNDALRGAGDWEGHDADAWLLRAIDRLKARLVPPEHAEQQVVDLNGAMAEHAGRVAQAYRLYEDELRRSNALDFNSLILQAYRLLDYPAMARHYRSVYRYWLVDEFQDTNEAQYALLRCMVGHDFRRIFAVADDDQTIFEWNGANVRRIGDLVRDFSCQVVQLPTNFRCPPRIVEAANRLVVYNAARVAQKRPARAAEGSAALPDEDQVQCREFPTDRDEAAGLACEIARLDARARGRTAVLARNKWLLEQIRAALVQRGVSAIMAARRDDFVTPQMRWLVACLRQIHRPLDRRNMAVLVETFNCLTPAPLDADMLASRSEAESVTSLAAWTDAVREIGAPPQVAAAVDVMATLAAGGIKLHDALPQILRHFGDDGPDEDLKDDLRAWSAICKEIRSAHGVTSLDRFLQELQLRCKQPPPAPGAVTLTTIHGAKGLEFDTVYLIGLAEEILPSWHSVQKGDGSAALEEERRGCFVAITRTRERFVLSRADRYRGYLKEPSRFLVEMAVCVALPSDRPREA